MKLTDEQIQTITSALEEAYDFIDGLTHITDEEREKWNGNDGEDGLVHELDHALEILRGEG